MCSITQYQLRCTVTCDEGYTRDNMINGTYLCNVIMKPNVVSWVALDGAACQKS